MPKACRHGDKAFCPADAHGKPCCPHPVTGAATTGSPDVIINYEPALRVGDQGTHTACCGSNTWEVAEGSPTVMVNNMPLARVGGTRQTTAAGSAR
jgi:uncharacterized Zn-binding protein involved in type VI secretion